MGISSTLKHEQQHAGTDQDDGGPLWHTNADGRYWCGNWYKRTPEQLLDECLTTIQDLQSNHPELQRVSVSNADELRREQEAVTEAHSEIARLEDELSRTKKELTDAELAWQSMDWWAERYETWPDDIKRKLSVHDLQRMAGWRPSFERDGVVTP